MWVNKSCYFSSSNDNVIVDPPSILSDGNTWGWFDFTNSSNLTKDINNYVSQVTDLSNSGNHLLQTNQTNKPLFTDGIVRFNGVDDYMKTATSPLIQPIMIYGVYKLLRYDLTYNSYFYIIDGDASSSSKIFGEPDGLNKEIILWGGVYGNSGIYEQLNLKHSIIALANGASSFVKMFGDTSLMNIGTNSMNGLILGSPFNINTLFYTNIEWSELIIRKISDTSTNEAIISDYLNQKYGL